MTLLKDLIDIIEHFVKGQFVLRLTEGVTDCNFITNCLQQAQAISANYVHFATVILCPSVHSLSMLTEDS